MSHTIKVLAIGFALLAVCVIAARLLGGPQPEYVARAALVFIGLWFVAAGINMWIGVSKAGYSVEEAPIFLLVFSIPAAVALLVWWRASRG